MRDCANKGVHVRVERWESECVRALAKCMFLCVGIVVHEVLRNVGEVCKVHIYLYVGCTCMCMVKVWVRVYVCIGGGK